MKSDIENKNVENKIDNIENIEKIKRRRKRIFGGYRKRERNMCPKCDSLDVAKRTTTHDYKCYNCGWIGKNVKKIMY